MSGTFSALVTSETHSKNQDRTLLQRVIHKADRPRWSVSKTLMARVCRIYFFVYRTHSYIIHLFLGFVYYKVWFILLCQHAPTAKTMAKPSYRSEITNTDMGRSI
jgi:hypothetical protein